MIQRNDGPPSVPQLSKPRKVPIPERYVESDPEEPLGPEELEERCRRTERIKNLLAKSRSHINRLFSSSSMFLVQTSVTTLRIVSPRKHRPGVW